MNKFSTPTLPESISPVTAFYNAKAMYTSIGQLGRGRLATAVNFLPPVIKTKASEPTRQK
jgi:hypothetical protein